MKFIQCLIFLTLTDLLAFGQENVSLFYKTKDQQDLHYVELTNGVYKVYQMGKYFNKPGSGYAILKIDTLKKVSEQNFVGKLYILKNDANILTLETTKRKRLCLEEVTDTKSVFLNLNNAYCLSSYFKLSDSLNAQFPLNHYSFRNGYYAWEGLKNKESNHEEFKRYIDIEIESIYDSVSLKQKQYTCKMSFLIDNINSLKYSIIKDSLTDLPKEYRSISWYFGKAVYEISKQKPDYFYRIAEDFPEYRDIIFAAVSDDKQLVGELKKVQGHDHLKNEFIKDYKFGKSMPYKIIGVYAIIGGLLAWLIISQ